MAKRKFRCVKCGFKGKSPFDMNTHYQANPPHAPRSSIVNENPYRNLNKRSKRILHMTHKAIRDRERRAEQKAGTHVDLRFKTHKVVKPKHKKKPVSRHPMAKRSRKYRKSILSGKHTPKPHRSNQPEPQPEAMLMTAPPPPPPPLQMPDCIPCCPRCRLNLSILNRAYQVTIQEEQRNA